MERRGEWGGRVGIKKVSAFFGFPLQRADMSRDEMLLCTRNRATFSFICLWRLCPNLTFYCMSAKETSVSQCISRSKRMHVLGSGQERAWFSFDKSINSN